MYFVLLFLLPYVIHGCVRSDSSNPLRTTVRTPSVKQPGLSYLRASTAKRLVSPDAVPCALTPNCRTPSWHLRTADVGPSRISGYTLAIDLFAAAFADVAAADPALYNSLGPTIYSTCCRCIRRNGVCTSSYSNHAYGMAIDLFIGGKLDTPYDGCTQQGHLRLLPYMNARGFYWGGAFGGGGTSEDSMHYEVSNELALAWLAGRELPPPLDSTAVVSPNTPCSYMGESGQCWNTAKCTGEGGASFPSSSGASGCETYPADVRCCVLADRTGYPCSVGSTSGSCELAEDCSGYRVASADGATGCQALPASIQCCVGPTPPPPSPSTTALVTVTPPPATPPPAADIPCVYRGSAGSCLTSSACDGSLHSAASGAAGCEAEPAAVQCCVRGSDSPCVAYGNAGSCQPTSLCTSGQLYPSVSGVVWGCERFPVDVQCCLDGGVPPAPTPPGETAGSLYTLTTDQLTCIFPPNYLGRPSSSDVSSWIEFINRALLTYGVSRSHERLAHFFAQTGVETDQFNTFEEYSDTTCTRYSGGCTYKGRGAIQLTHDYNYRMATAALDVDFYSNPSLVATPRYAFATAGVFWQSRGLNQWADRQDMDRITSIVTGCSGSQCKATRAALQEEIAARVRRCVPKLADEAGPETPSTCLVASTSELSTSGSKGTCISTTDCSNVGGTTYRGFCPTHPASVLCCVRPGTQPTLALGYLDETGAGSPVDEAYVSTTQVGPDLGDDDGVDSDDAEEGGLSTAATVAIIVCVAVVCCVGLATMLWCTSWGHRALQRDRSAREAAFWALRRNQHKRSRRTTTSGSLGTSGSSVRAHPYQSAPAVDVVRHDKVGSSSGAVRVQSTTLGRPLPTVPVRGGAQQGDGRSRPLPPPPPQQQQQQQQAAAADGTARASSHSLRASGRIGRFRALGAARPIDDTIVVADARVSRSARSSGTSGAGTAVHMNSRSRHRSRANSRGLGDPPEAPPRRRPGNINNSMFGAFE